MRTPPRHLALLLGVLLATVARIADAAIAPTAAVEPCGDVGCLPAHWGPGQVAAGFGVGDFRPGQTFAPQFTGVLTEVHLGLETNGVVGAIAEIRPVVNGVPTSTVLAEAPVPGAPYTGGLLYAADFSAQNLVLTVGTRYAVTLRANAPQIISILAAFPACHSATTGTFDYVYSDDAGQTWAMLPTRDRSIIFEVCMDLVTPTRASTWGSVKAIYR